MGSASPEFCVCLLDLLSGIDRFSFSAPLAPIFEHEHEHEDEHEHETTVAELIDVQRQLHKGRKDHRLGTGGNSGRGLIRGQSTIRSNSSVISVNSCLKISLRVLGRALMKSLSGAIPFDGVSDRSYCPTLPHP